MSSQTSYSNQTVELTLKGRAVGSGYRTINRTVRLDDQGAFIQYNGQQIRVNKLGQDGIDWVGNIQH